MFNQETITIEKEIHSYCAENDIPLAELKWQPIPFNGEWGTSTSFFQTAANEAKNGKKVKVPMRAQEIAEAIKNEIGTPTGISRVEAVRGYLNLYFVTEDFAERTISAILQEKSSFGRGKPKHERVMVEYAQPNTHHSFHIGHYRNAILGESLSRLVEFAGFETIRAAYPGDIGLGVITVLWIYEKFYKGQEPDGVHERGQWLLNLYVEATNMLTEKENETDDERILREKYDAERREMYLKWDAGDEYIRDLWLETREWSLDELKDILLQIGIQIDTWFFESVEDEPSKAVVQELLDLDIATDERDEGGAVLVKIDEKLGLKKEKYRTNVLLRNDGTTLYLTKDLSLAKKKFNEFGVDRSIYVVDVRQSLHFMQAFAILGLWGFEQAEKCYHLGYGFVSLPGGAMSARKGRVVIFKDVADEAIRRFTETSKEKNPNLSDEQRAEVAETVGLGALAYAMLSVDNSRDTVFDMDVALSFEGRTGPYIQNAHVRASSILKKFKVEGSKLKAENLKPATFNFELTSHEIELIELLSRFPAVVEDAANQYRPMIMATYAYDLASAFHSFYHAVPVLKSETDSIRDARLRLVKSAKQTLANALDLLAIKAPDAM
ncbi:MAG: arginine--tRNA ligase [Anaerolineae bacterium]|jgi:arginyl-tRNA synthetase|nr:arginine--tRNA ligase [Anaerolineae bacterium]MBT4457865.1 arginine--tRNA ligase [Anaerolineae bacterium]MBT4842054.1 arginine--tRNA ligase [Anaerolineae bacterium]MBT6060313.1 arginine--tRNA ligase [Anaerolineae bacterium]MBT6320832.1 arginine--tRNA ligase [Anaerolineae bacterium]